MRDPFGSLTTAATFLLALMVCGGSGRADEAGAAPHVAAPLPANMYPAGAFPVTVAERDTLQQALDAHHSVRLLPGDYGPGPITLRSGEHLYGLPGTKLQTIIVEPGTTGALVSGVQSNVIFPASDAVTRDNTFLRTNSSIVVKGGSLEDNLFVDARNLDVDVTAGGYLRNNRFIRAPGQLQGNNMLKFLASPDRPSTGNVFFWVNSGAPVGPTSAITGVPDLTIAAVDAEMWSFKMKQPTALFVTGPMERLNLFAVQGGRYDKDPDVRKSFGLIDSPAREVRVFGLTCGYRGQTPDLLPAKILLQEGNERSLFVGCLPYSYSIPSTSILHVKAFDQTHGVEGIAAAAATSPVVVEPVGALQTEQAAFKDMILQTGRTMHPWDRPTFDPPPNPAGDDGIRNAATAPDQAPMLQDRLDKEGIVVLPAGKYYIATPLRINGNKGIVGAGMDQTVIIAKDPGMSLFVYDPEGKTRTMTLANLTLEGGRVGMHVQGEGLDHPLSSTCLTHLTFRNMSEAGFFLDMPNAAGAGSFDNNFISFCNFVNCGAGLKQDPPPTGGWGFIDKLVVYRCQFLDCGVGVDFPAARTNDLNSYVECLFKGNTGAVARLVHNTTTTFANCDFIDNAGDPVVASDDWVYFLSCRFHGGPDAKSLLPARSCAEGCVFEPDAPATSTVVVKTPKQNHFYNCRVEMPLGPLKDGLLLNNQFDGQPDLSQLAVSVLDGQPSVIVPGPTQPGPQILVTGSRAGTK
jgi:hypothetical protein